MENHFEITIIGGGPAGSTTAIYLSDYGFNVCLIEKKAFPRETLCGEFLSAEVMNNLKELNLFHEFLSLKPNPIKSFCFFNKNGKTISSELNFSAFGLRRSVFDDFLLKTAIEKGTTVLQPAEVKSIYNSGKVFIIGTDYKNQKLNIKSDFVIGAYGKQNIMDKHLARNFTGIKTRLNGIKFHVDKDYLKDFPQNEIHIYSAGNIYCGINIVDSNTATLCFLEDRKQWNLSARNHLLELVKINKSFNKIFPAAFEDVIKELPAYGTGNIFFGKRNLVEKGVFMVGDSAGVIAPLAGDGIGMAMDSAKILSEILYYKKSNHLSLDETGSLYSDKWNRNFSKRLKTAGFIQKMVLKDEFTDIAVSVIRRFPGMMNYFVHATRN
jgi:hypothetical protein